MKGSDGGLCERQGVMEIYHLHQTFVLWNLPSKLNRVSKQVEGRLDHDSEGPMGFFSFVTGGKLSLM